MRMIRTYVLLVRSHPAQLVADAVSFDLNNLAIGIVELVAGQGILSHLSHDRRTCVYSCQLGVQAVQAAI